MKINDNFYNEIYEYVKTLKIIDTHEHLNSKELKQNYKSDILSEYLIHYFSCDLISAGFTDIEKIRSNEISIMEKWDLVEDYWNKSKYTGYGRSLEFAARDLYDINGINRENIEELNKRFLDTRTKGNHYDYVLKEKSNIEVSILGDYEQDYDKRYFKCAKRLEQYLQPEGEKTIDMVEDTLGTRINTFNDWLEACEAELDEAIKDGCVAIKTNIAYRRPIYFDEKVTKNDAQKQFYRKNILKYISPNFETPFGREYEDFMMHFVLQMANKRGLTVQIHTGILEGNGNILENSNPTKLNNLFMLYPDIKFDIFHMGYPFEHTLSALAKNFSNVFIDMCWAHIISPIASINALVEWIDAIPLNKISAFGGDYVFVDGVYGHQYMARQNISKALAIKVQDGLFGVEEAKKIAKMLFYDNPKGIFGL